MTGITSRGAGETGARGKISGTISNGATWWEDVELTEDGTVITNADTWTWRMTFRSDPNNDSADLTLSTTDGTLTISQGADATTLQIRVVYTALSAMDGDYICDIASLDTSTTPDKLVHWASGVVTFRNEPIWSS
jgi:hypothetical protein